MGGLDNSCKGLRTSITLSLVENMNSQRIISFEAVRHYRPDEVLYLLSVLSLYEMRESLGKWHLRIVRFQMTSIWVRGAVNRSIGWGLSEMATWQQNALKPAADRRNVIIHTINLQTIFSQLVLHGSRKQQTRKFHLKCTPVSLSKKQYVSVC